MLLTDAGQAFNLLLLIGAGRQPVYPALVWWRINAWTELVAMGGSLVVAGYFTFVHDGLDIVELAAHEKQSRGSLLTTLVWVVATYLTPPESDKTLSSFVAKVNPGGPGWKRWYSRSYCSWPVPRASSPWCWGAQACMPRSLPPVVVQGRIHIDDPAGGGSRRCGVYSH